LEKDEHVPMGAVAREFLEAVKLNDGEYV